MADDIEVHFDSSEGTLTLTCGDEAFARIRQAVVAEAGVAEIIVPGPADVQHIEIELQPLTHPHARLHDYLWRGGCLLLGAGFVFVVGVGVVTIVSWVW